MGAFSSMVIQLIIFGIYTANIKIHKIDKKLSLAIVFEKFIILPVIGYLFLQLLGLNSLLIKVILLEVMVPIAVSNVNLAALFDTEPEEVAWLVILTSILFIPYFLIVAKFI
jgi:predicted permease